MRSVKQAVLLCALLTMHIGHAFNRARLHVTSDVRAEPQSGDSLKLTPETLRKDRLIIASHSVHYNGNNPKNALHKEDPIQSNFLLSADRMQQEEGSKPNARLREKLKGSGQVSRNIGNVRGQRTHYRGQISQDKTAHTSGKIGNERGQIPQDRTAHASRKIGNERGQISQDRTAHVSGKIGNERGQISQDRTAHASRKIGNERGQIPQDRTAHVSGKIGNERGQIPQDRTVHPSGEIDNEWGQIPQDRTAHVSGEIGDERGQIPHARTAHRKKRDIYSIIDKALRKRHNLDSDEDIRRLLVALNTIRDFLEADKELSGDLSQLDLQGSLGISSSQDTQTPHTKIDLGKNLSRQKSLPIFMRGPSEKPSPPHPQDLRNKHYNPRQIISDESSGSVEHLEVSGNGLALAVRTGPHEENENSLVEKSPFYPEFNPTGW